jgi:PAS domain S-box-containing protein
MRRSISYKERAYQDKNAQESRFLCRGYGGGGGLMEDRFSIKELEKGRNALKNNLREIYKEKISSPGKSEEEFAELEERYRILLEQGDVGIAIIQDRLLKYVNHCLMEISGYTEEELIDSPFGIYIHPDELPRMVNCYMRRMAGEEAPSKYESVFKNKEGQDRRIEINASRIEYQGKPADLVIVRDVTESRRTEKVRSSLCEISGAIREADNLEEFLTTIHNIVSSLMPADDNFYIALYDRVTDMLDYPYFVDKHMKNPGPHKPGKGLTEYVLLRGESLLASPERIIELAEKGVVESVGLPSYNWAGAPIKIGNQTIGVMAVQSYKEETKYREEDQYILELFSGLAALAVERIKCKDELRKNEMALRRIHHQVKNNMQLIISLLRLQSSQIKDKETLQILEAFQGRVRSMALIHESLYQSEGLENVEISDYLTRMTSQLLIEFKEMEEMIRINLDMEKIYLDGERAVLCGLIVHELVSNALRHAFPEGEKGEIFLNMHEDIDSTYVLTVKDTGIGFPKGLDYRRTKTLGMQLVNAWVTQLNGTIRLRRKEGTEFRIVF